MSILDLSVPTEQWRPVVGYEGLYEVSDHGRVRSTRTRSIRRTRLNRTGRVQLDLSRDGRRSTIEVHRLVLIAFVGPCPDGMEGCHGDGNPTNNQLTNLRWDTHSENNRDAVRHGTHPWSSRTHCLNDHEYTDENTYLDPSGWRRCRTCQQARLRRHRAKAMQLRTKAVAA